MKRAHEESRPLGPDQLRMLLAFARELFQTDAADSSRELVGRSLVDMLHPESALLLLPGAPPDAVGFDSRGRASHAGPDHPLFQACLSLLSDVQASANAADAHGNQREDDGSATLAVAVPSHRALAALAATWKKAPGQAQRDRARQAMSSILELAAAALGKIDARNTLEQLVCAQREQIATTSEVHAAELAQRDEAAAEMHTLSLTDVLTGLYNRRGFFLQAEQVFKVSRRKRTKSAVIFADVDGLKRVNDELGHETGDRLICDAAHVFRQSFRQADVISRIGGDEFVAFTLDDEQPEIILARIQANLHAFNLMQERPYAVSISAGVVQCDPWDKRSLSHYVLLADEQMYVRKRSRLH
ncbi:MAG: GGDEF domain-containing protein [Pseudomonadota bacterium]